MIVGHIELLTFYNDGLNFDSKHALREFLLVYGILRGQGDTLHLSVSAYRHNVLVRDLLHLRLGTRYIRSAQPTDET